MILSFVDADKRIIDILKKQIYNKNIQYIYSPYVIKLWKENNYLLKNLLTKECIMLKDLSSDEKILVEKWFKIPKNLDPYLLFEKIQNEGNLSQKNFNNYNLLSNFSHAVVFTTLNCNANCFYCYQHDQKNYNFQKNMSLEVADKFVERIKKNNIKKTFRLSWFGGEPLCNYKIIDYICNKLKENNIEYSSTMISNAILFSKQIIEEQAIKNWKLRNIQITVDGIYEHYEQIKQVPKGSFKRLISNIEYLLQNDIYVNIRLNLSEKNYIYLKEVIYFFYKQKFNKYKNFRIYVHEIFFIEESKHKQLYKNLKKLNSQISYYFNIDPRLIEWTSACCMADKGDTISLLPNGDIGICEHSIDNDIVTNLNHDFYNVNIINDFSKCSKREECKSCKLRPACVFLEKCYANSGNNCSEARRELILYNHKIDLINQIEKYRRKRRRHLMITKELYTNIDIYNKATALIEAFNTQDSSSLNYPVKINFYLQKNMNTLINLAREIEQKRIEIVQKFGTKKEDSDEYTIPEDKVAEASQELQDFFDLEQEVPINMMKLEWFDKIDMTAAQVNAISFMIEEEE